MDILGWIGSVFGVVGISWLCTWISTTTLLLIIGIIFCSFTYIYKKQHYWQSLNVEVPPFKYFFGHAPNLHKFGYPTRWRYLDEIYKTHKKSGYVGFYEYIEPSLMVFDLTILRHILLKDFDYFTDRFHVDLSRNDDEYLGELLTVSPGHKWKPMRSIVSSTFSTSKMRSMYSLIYKHSDTLVDYYKKTDGLIPISSSMNSYTLDVIASCAFGLDLNSSDVDKMQFFRKAKSVFPFINMKKLSWYQLMPKLFSFFGIRLSAPEGDFFVELAKLIIKERKQTGLARGDFLDLLLAALNKEKNTTVTETVVAAQVLLFLLAGYDTTANTLAFTLYLLAKHPIQQDLIRKEVQSLNRMNGEIFYEDLMANKKLDSLILETLRLYPAATFIQRKCTKQYKIPGTSLIIPVGMVLFVPVYSIQRDPEYWSNPEDFQADRFTNGEPKDPFASLSFGEGPRNCVGKRFALMESKLTIAKIVENFDLSLPEGQNELSLGPFPIMLQPAKEIFINMKPLC